MANPASLIWNYGHDHRRCVADALGQAIEVCETGGARFTPLRRRVLELIWNSHQPVGAYAILDTLRDERAGSAPPTVYRALEFLIEHGLVHRIASLNAYIGCSHPAVSHGGQFLICRACGEAVELDDGRIDRAVQACAGDADFEVSGRIVEVIGVCPGCRRDGEGERA